MIAIYSPITLKLRKELILKCIAELKREYKIKKTKKYITNKISELLDNMNFDINSIIIQNEFSLYEKLNNIASVKISREFIEQIMNIDNKLINSKTIFLILSSYLEMQILKIEKIYEEEKKLISENFSLENLHNEYQNIFLSDNQLKNIEKKYNTNAKVLSHFKKSIAYYYHVYFKYTKEESEELARDLSWSLFNDKKKANFTRDYYREREFQIPTYFGKYISFM